MISGKRGQRETSEERPGHGLWREGLQKAKELGRAQYRKLRKAVRRRSPMLSVIGLLCAAGLLLIPSLPKGPGGPDPSREDTDPSADPGAGELVTREQADKLRYTDSVLGVLEWELTDESLAELNRVLAEYGIESPEAIAQFLAQATVESAAGAYLTELGDDAYFRKLGYSAGTRGAGYLHLTHDYGQMGFAVWEMKRNVPELSDIVYRSPADFGRESVAQSYFSALQRAANLGLDISRYSRIVYDETASVKTGAEYIADEFAWESAGYYWYIAGVEEAFSPSPGVENTDIATRRVGGQYESSRREAYLAFSPVFLK